MMIVSYLTIREKAVEGYSPAISGTQGIGFTVTNTINTKISIPVTKVWNGKGDHPASVKVRLLANGKEIASQLLSDANNWQYTFVNLERSKGGQPIQYTVTEDAVPGFSSSTSGDANSEYGFVFTNTKLKPNDPGNSGNGGNGGNGSGNNGGGNNGGGNNGGTNLSVKQGSKNPSSVLGDSRNASTTTPDAKGQVKGEGRDPESKNPESKEPEVERDTKTSDQSRALQYLLLFAVSACGFVGYLYTDKKKKA